MESIQSLRAEFIRIYEEMMEVKGLPTVLGTVMATLVLSQRELTHDEISELTGYSVSSISRTLAQLIRLGFVYKRKDVSQRKFVYYIRGGFANVMADSYELKLREFTAQKEVLRSLSERVDRVDSGMDSDEINNLRTRIGEIERTLEILLTLVSNCVEELKKV